MCTYHSLVSVTTVQSWFMWSAVYARWLVRCESLSGPPANTSTAVLERFFSVLLSLKEMSLATMAQEVVQITCDSIKDMLKVQDKLRQLIRRVGGSYKLVPLTPPPPKKKGTKRLEQQVMQKGAGLFTTISSVGCGVCGAVGGVAYGALFGPLHTDIFHVHSFIHSFCGGLYPRLGKSACIRVQQKIVTSGIFHMVVPHILSALKIEPLPVKQILSTAPWNLALAIVCCCALGHMNLFIHLDKWHQREWKPVDGSLLEGLSVLKVIFKTRQEREGLVCWHTSLPQRSRSQRIEVQDFLKVGLRLIRPPTILPAPLLGMRGVVNMESSEMGGKLLSIGVDG